jgi:hypothetical protein
MRRLSDARMAAPESKRPPRLVAKFALALAATVSVLLLAELSLRLLGMPGPPQFSQGTTYLGIRLRVPEEPLPGLTDPGQPDFRGRLYRYAPHSVWASRYPSDPRSYFNGDNIIEYSMNNYGFRGPDFQLTKRRPRIACIGDSLTLGEGVRWEHTFPALLEKRLSASSSQVEVMNFGVNGYELLHERALLEQVVSAFSPDFVVWQFYPNDIAVFDVEELSVEIRESENSWRLQSTPSHLVNWISRRLWAWRATARMKAGMLEIYARRWDELSAEFARVQRLTERIGAGLLVVVFPDLDLLSRGDYALHPIHTRLAELFDDQGIRHIDLTGLFAEHGPERLRVHPMDWHPNEIAHRLAADALIAELADHPDLSEPRQQPSH